MNDYAIPIDFIPDRVVSLIPSMTESLFDLGLGSSVVGITDYCIYPQEKLNGIHRIGGPKTLRITEILELKPQLVIANQEENSEAEVKALRNMGVPVWLTFPTSVDMAVTDLWNLVRLFRSDRAAKTVTFLEKYIETQRNANFGIQKRRYFCPIWQEQLDCSPWWMTFNQETYSNDLLSLLGGENVFGHRFRKYPIQADLGQAEEENPGTRDIRYPHVIKEEIIAASPDYILLPNEPYKFKLEDIKVLLEGISDAKKFQPRILEIEGSLITWPGTRIGKAITELGDIFLN